MAAVRAHAVALPRGVADAVRGAAFGPIREEGIRRAVIAHSVTELRSVADAGGGSALAGELGVRRAGTVKASIENIEARKRPSRRIARPPFPSPTCPASTNRHRKVKIFLPGCSRDAYLPRTNTRNLLPLLRFSDRESEWDCVVSQEHDPTRRLAFGNRARPGERPASSRLRRRRQPARRARSRPGRA
jgi:hypothetical protein